MMRRNLLAVLAIVVITSGWIALAATVDSRELQTNRAYVRESVLAERDFPFLITLLNDPEVRSALAREPGLARITALKWTKPYFVDADHIDLKTVHRFLPPCDFFTLDVAESIGRPAKSEDINAFVERHPELIGDVLIPHIEEPLRINEAFVKSVANKFLAAV